MTTAVPERELDDLWDDGDFILSRVKPSSDRPPALFVRPSAAYPADATIARLEHAHSLRGELDSSWAARPTDLIGPRERLALRLEDPGGAVLATLLGKPWDVTSFLRVAVGVASALSGLHGCGLVHKDVKPSNVLVNVATTKAWLTGFGIASRLRRERQSHGHDPAPDSRHWRDSVEDQRRCGAGRLIQLTLAATPNPSAHR
jgi:hypothetical protein